MGKKEMTEISPVEIGMLQYTKTYSIHKCGTVNPGTFWKSWCLNCVEEYTPVHMVEQETFYKQVKGEIGKCPVN